MTRNFCRRCCFASFVLLDVVENCGVVVVVVDCFYIVLFSALKQTHCARMCSVMLRLLSTLSASVSKECVTLLLFCLACLVGGC